MSKGGGLVILEALTESIGVLFWRTLPPWSSIPIAVIGSIIICKLAPAPELPGGVQLKIFGFMAGGLFFVVCLIGGGLGWNARRHERVLLQQKIDPSWFNNLSWQDFERAVADVYRSRGYVVEIVGGGGADGGVDLRMFHNDENILVQCKRWRAIKVGVQAVRELFGVMAHENAQRCILVASGTYTDEARRFSEGKPMDLIDGAQFAAMMREYQAAIGARVGRETAPEMNVNEAVPRAPTCPECNSPMVLRRARKGARVGLEFWGCSTFPKCRGTVNLS